MKEIFRTVLLRYSLHVTVNHANTGLTIHFRDFVWAVTFTTYSKGLKGVILSQDGQSFWSAMFHNSDEAKAAAESLAEFAKIMDNGEPFDSEYDSPITQLNENWAAANCPEAVGLFAERNVKGGYKYGQTIDTADIPPIELAKEIADGMQYASRLKRTDVLNYLAKALQTLFK